LEADVKKERTKNIEYQTLQQVLDFVHAAVIAENPDMTYKDFTFRTEYSYGDDCYPSLEYQTEETDAERRARERTAKNTQMYKRLQYERLKEEFEGKSS
jgi:hypothetical protein